MTNQRNSPVGYGVPPDHGKFKKGQSGNLSGRPKVRMSPLDMYMDEFLKPVPIIVEGKRKMIPAIRAFAMKDRQLVLSGHATTARAVRALLMSYSAKSDDARSEEEWEADYRNGEKVRHRLYADLDRIHERMKENEEFEKSRELRLVASDKSGGT